MPDWYVAHPLGNFGERAVIIGAKLIDTLVETLSWRHIYFNLEMKALIWVTKRAIARRRGGDMRQTGRWLSRTRLGE